MLYQAADETVFLASKYGNPSFSVSAGGVSSAIKIKVMNASARQLAAQPGFFISGDFDAAR